jgi:hypothetical protein
MIPKKENVLGRRNMTNTQAVSHGRVELDAIVARLNVQRFCKLFTEVDETRRQTLLHLIAEEKAKLDALVASP